MVAAIVGVTMAAGAAYTANKASNSADRATESQARMGDNAYALGQDQLAFDKQVYEDGAEFRDAAQKTALEVSQAQLDSMRQNDALAEEYANYNRTTFRPLEQGLVRDAEGYDTAGRRAEAANEARADVEQNFGMAQQDLTRNIMRMGGSIGGSRSNSMMQDAALAKAKAITGATSKAVDNIETQGWARRMDAANLGRGLPSAQATSATIASNAGTSAVGTALQGVQAQTSGANLVNQGYHGAMSGALGAGQIYGNIADLYGRQAASATQAMGQIGGAFGRMYASDEEKKTGTDKPADTAEMLEQVEATPVKTGWMYDPNKGGPDDGGVPHDGPMAQQVRRTMGEKAAPGGKVIDIATMNGRLIGGMQELAKRVKKLEMAA